MDNIYVPNVAGAYNARILISKVIPKIVWIFLKYIPKASVTYAINGWSFIDMA